MRLKFLDPLSKDQEVAIVERAWSEATSDLKELGAKHWLTACRFLLTKMNIRRLLLERSAEWRRGAFEEIDRRLTALEERSSHDQPNSEGK